MNNKISFILNKNISWEVILPIRQKIINFLKFHDIDEDSSIDILMCITELSENAIKHGDTSEGGFGIHFKIEIIQNSVIIEVKNRINNLEKINNFLYHIKKISNADDIAQIYLERLTGLLESDGQESNELGLYRIAYEGNFIIKHRYDDSEKVLSISCNRKI